MKRFLALIMALLLVLGLGSAASAAEIGTEVLDPTVGKVWILVVDSEGNAVPNETLTVSLVDFNVDIDVVTDDNGFYRFDAPAGKYAIGLDVTNYSGVATMTLPITDYVELSVDNAVNGKLTVNEFSISKTNTMMFVQVIVSR